MKGKVAFYTLGCKLNFSETSTIGKQFLDKGFEVVNFSDSADVYVINTCTVTEGADRECRQIVRRALRNNPEAFVAVTGCYTQLRPDEVVNIEGVDLVLGSNDKFELINHIDKLNKKAEAGVFVTPFKEMTEFYAASSTDADSRTRAFLKIQDGCDYTCTYCTIPLARGKSRSSDEKVVIQKFNELLADGYKEIILTGVNVGEYGRDKNSSLYELLLKLVELPGEFRIRISSIEPNLLTDEIIELTKTSSKLCKHFHIPLQSGSRKILKLMQRRYKIEKFLDRVKKVRTEIPNAGIGIDVIVGFPGEGEEEFNETYNLLETVDFSYLHVFTYSERPDTPAIEMPDPVEMDERKKRNNKLRLLSEKKNKFFFDKMIGQETEVLFEHTEKDGKMRGFASNYLRLEKEYAEDEVNRLVKIKISICSQALSDM